MPSPGLNAIDIEQAKAVDTDPSFDDDYTEQPDQIRSTVTDLLLVPGFRFNGTSSNPMWNYPEEVMFDWMTKIPLEKIEYDVMSGVNGVFWGRITRPDYESQSVIVKYPAVGNDKLLSVFGTELCLELPEELASRELAAYELLKAIGNEDIGCPICIKDLPTAGLLSDVIRETIARELKISKTEVGLRLGLAATMQLVPPALDNFMEIWGGLGVTNSERWHQASDQLRYSIYRAYFTDFILGVPTRSIAEFQYNKNTDRIMMTDLKWSFAHSGFSTEKYLQMRLKGWGRASGGSKKFTDNAPASAYDLSALFDDLEDKYLEEALLTAQQISQRMDDAMVQRLIMVLLEYDVPIECVACVILRLSYLAFSPGSVIKRPIEYIRNLCAPIRMETVGSDPRIIEAITFVNTAMSAVIGENFDMAGVLTQPSPDLAELLV